jgi:hypothetical protein
MPHVMLLASNGANITGTAPYCKAGRLVDRRVSIWSKGGKGFVKGRGSRMSYVVETHVFRKLFDKNNQDDKQARLVVKWLHDEAC